MIDFLTFLSDDEALHKFNDNISGLAGLTDVEETLLLSNSFKMKKKTLIVVKENLAIRFFLIMCQCVVISHLHHLT